MTHPAQLDHLTTAEVTRISATLTPVQMVEAAVILVLLLWIAYRIGRVILSLLGGLLFLGLVGFGLWYLFYR